MNKVAEHYYQLGVQLALNNTGMEKSSNYRLMSRLAPMGSRNIAAGAGHSLGGALIGKGLSAMAPQYSAEMIGLGTLAGKLLKDRNTLRIAKNLGPLERAAVAKELGSGVAERIGGATASLVGGGPITAIPEIITNQLVRKRLGI